MFLTFQSSFDGTAYQRAKTKDRQANGHKSKKAAKSPKPIYAERSTTKLTTETSDIVTMAVGREFPPTQTLPPIDVYALTAKEESLVPLPKSTSQQVTQEKLAQEQVIQVIEGGNIQDVETIIHEASAERSYGDLTEQGSSPKDDGMLVNGVDAVQHSGRNNKQESVDSVSAHGLIPSAQPSNGVAGLPTDAASNAVPTCWESRGTEAAGLSRCSNLPSQDAPEIESNRVSTVCGQAAHNHESGSSDGGVRPELSMDDGEDMLPDEWEGRIIGEEAGEYSIAWKDSFIPKEYASTAMVQTWNAKKAKIAGDGKRGVVTEIKQPGAIRGRVKKRGTGKRGRGRGRV